MIAPHPPKWATKLLRTFIKKDFIDEIEGDLNEVFEDDLTQFDIKKARRLYALEVLKLFRLNLVKNLKWINKLGIIMLITRNLKFAFRNLLKFKTHSAINLIGLSIGLSVGTLILFYVMDELSFDNFHEKGDRLFKVVSATQDGGMETNAWPVAYKLKTEYPEVEEVVYTRRAPANFVLNHEDQSYNHELFFVENSFFELFSFTMISGDPKKALSEPNTIVITKTLQDIYFDGDAMGKTVTVRDDLNYKITGVVADPPANSHIQFDGLISFKTFEQYSGFSYTDGWGNFNVRNYILMKEGADVTAFAGKIENLYEVNVGDWLKEMGVSVTSELIPMDEVYLNSTYYNGFGPNGSMKRVKTVGWIAVFLLALACINYINLSTARSIHRMKEVAIKKLIGSTRQAVIFQFLLEAFLLTTISLIVSLFIVQLSLPFFNEVMDKNYMIKTFIDAEFMIGLATLVFLITVFAGFYPALILSGFKPLQAVKGDAISNTYGLKLRKTLIVFQYFISSGLVIATLLVISQIDYMKNQSLGFNKDQVLVIDATNTPPNNSRQVLKSTLQTIPGVISVSHTNALPGRPGWHGQWAYAGKITPDQHVETEYMAIDESYLNTLDLELLAGQNFDLSHPSTLENGLIINESCVKAMKWLSPAEAIGQEIVSPSQRPAGIVIGVVKDYHGLGLQQNIWPKAMDYSSDQYGRYLAIKYDTKDTYTLIKQIEKTWEKSHANYNLDYFFLDQDFDRQYREETQLAQVLTIFAVVVMIVSIIGLVGLVSFVALSKTKEIGLRKTLGANVSQIIYILSKEFVWLVLLGNLLVMPILWHYGNDWLDTFAYHTTINPMIFLLACLASLGLTITVVSLMTYRSARQNPILALRYE